MLTVTTNSRCPREKEYICHVLFSTILDVPYNLTFTEGEDWQIQCPQGTIRIPDLLSTDYSRDLIPNTVDFIKADFTPERDIPRLFGRGEYHRQGAHAYLPVDIFASSFFMLTRWEEKVLFDEKDRGRFPGKRSLAVKEGFIHRPVVNEYALWLKAHFEHFGLPVLPLGTEYALVPTHDIDMIRMGKLKRFGGDILKHRSPRRFIHRLKLAGSNPWDNFDWLMDQSEKAGVTSRFFILPGGKARMDRDFSLEDPLIKRAIHRIEERRHRIGIHGSFSSADNPAQWENEYIRLQKLVNRDIKEGRQHYLRWIPGVTDGINETMGIEKDFTLGYHDKNGFRCGTACPFPLYDWEERRIRSLWEQPLIWMDVTAAQYEGLDVGKAFASLEHFKSLCLTYHMPFTYLVHNTSFDMIGWPGWQRAYQEFVGS